MRFSSLQILDGITDAAHGANKHTREVEAAAQTMDVNLDSIRTNVFAVQRKALIEARFAYNARRLHNQCLEHLKLSHRQLQQFAAECGGALK